MPVSSVTEHWIKQDALTINLNHFGDPDYLQVSVLAGAVVMAFKQDVIGYNAAHNYRTWPLQAANTYLETSSAVNVYARLTRSEVNASALIVYDPVLRDIEGREISYAEDGSELLGDSDPAFFYVFVGQITESLDSNGNKKPRDWNRPIIYGTLDSSEQKNYAGLLWEMMFTPHFDDPLNPDELTWIEAKKHIGVVGGISMFVNNGKVNLPSIYDDLPIDRDTIYWDAQYDDEGNVIGKVLKAKGGGTGGVDEEAVRTLIESYDYATKDFVRDYVLQNATGGEFELSKQMVIDALGFTPYSAENPNSYITAASIPSALKNPYGLTFGSKTYDGSSAKEITASDLGAALSSDLSKYLPLSGGTVSNATTTPLTVNSTNTEANLQVSVGGSGKALFGYKTGVGTWMRDSKAYNIVIGDDGVLKYGLNNNLNTIWHAGNDGSGSGLDADLLDGKQPNELSVLSSSRLNTTTSTTIGYNLIYNAGFIPQGTGVNGVWNAPTANYTESGVKGEWSGVLRLGMSNTYYNDLFFSMNENPPQWRQIVNGVSKGWRTFAFTDSNVASATYATSAGNADTLDGYDSSDFYRPASQHTISQNGVYDWMAFFTFTHESNNLNAGVVIDMYNSESGASQTYGRLLINARGTALRYANLVDWGNNKLPDIKITSDDGLTFKVWMYCNKKSYYPYIRMYLVNKVGLTASSWIKEGVVDTPTGTITDYTVVRGGYAAKLQTARTIWGQSFDGTADVTGSLKIPNDYTLRWFNNAGTDINGMYLSNENKFFIGNGVAENGYDTYLSGKNLIFRYGTSRTEGVRIDSSGNVGIGTTSPSAKLHVNGAANIGGTLTVGNTTSSELHFKRVDDTSVLCMHVSSSNNLHIGNGIAKSSKNTYVDGYNVYLRYGASPTAGMTLTSSGNVGIGIAEPSWKFNVEQTVDNTWAIVGQTPKSKVYLAQSSGRGIYAGVLSGVSTSYLLSLKYNQTTLGSGGSSALYVRTDGNIGIGTESPAYKLDVNGTASASRLVITSTNSVKQLEFSRVGGNSITTPEGGYLRIITNGKALGDNNADLVVNNGLVTINGNILATGGVTMQSQRSLKNVVDERGLSLTELSAIKPTRYTWKDRRDNRIHIGGIADDIEKVLPEVIYTTSDGTLTMDYGNAGFAIASSLIKPVVDHDTKIIDHDIEIRMLKIRVKELEEELKRYSA